MAGSSSITGNQTITFTDNMSFDGTDRGGAMTADGQLWIGATASNRANDGGHVRLGTITGSGGVVVTNGPGTINIAGTGPSTDLHAPRFIVASSTAGTGANFTSIASAIASAQGTGVNSTIFLQPGTYTENVTLVPGINLCAFDCDASVYGVPNVKIVGTLTLTTAGTVSISGICLQTNSAPLLAVTGSAASIITMTNCFLNCTNNTGITLSSTGGANITMYYCRGNLGTTGIGLFSMTGASSGLSMMWCKFTNTGGSTTASTASVGTINSQFNEFNFPITTSGTNLFGSLGNNYNCSTINTAALTIGGSGVNNSSFDYIAGGTASALSVGSTLKLSCPTISSSNTNSITGAGTVSISNASFIGTSSTVNTTTQTPNVSSNDAVKIVTPGAYPYTTVPQDNVILVDTSSARSIVPLASPTTGQKHVIKDSVGSAATNNITITPSGKNIDGTASKVITTNYGSMTIIYNGTEWSIV